MKKILFAFLAAAFVCSCSKYNYDDFKGAPDYSSEIGELYIRNIPERLIADNLLAVERALAYEAMSISVAERIVENANFRTGGVSLWKTGNRWIVNAVDAVKGVEIRKEDVDSTWTLSRDADYCFNGGCYPTACTMTVRMLPGGKDHFDWEVSVKGNRKERKGYSCTFSTVDPVVFLTGTSDRWSQCRGRIFMEVFRDGAKVDKCCIEYAGGSGSYKFINGL